MEKTAGVEPFGVRPSANFPTRFVQVFSRRTFCGSLSGKGSQRSCALARDAKDSPTFCWRCFSREPPVTPRSAFGKKHRGLARRIAAPDNNNRFIATNLTFHRRRSVVNAHILELFAPLRIEPAVIGARCNQNSFCSKNGGATLRLEADGVFAVGIVIKRRAWDGVENLRQSVSLKLSEPGQFRPLTPVGNPKKFSISEENQLVRPGHNFPKQLSSILRMPHTPLRPGQPVQRQRL